MSDPDRWHRLDEELEIKLRRPVRELAELEGGLDRAGTELAALEAMCAEARVELRAAESALEPGALSACADVLEHCVRGVADLRLVLAAARATSDSTRRFVAETALQYHDSVMPHMSDAELAVVRELNPFVPRNAHRDS